MKASRQVARQRQGANCGHHEVLGPNSSLSLFSQGPLSAAS